MGVLSFDEFKKQREEEQRRQEEQQVSQQPSQPSASPAAAPQQHSANYLRTQEAANNSGTLTFEQFQQARAAGTSYDDFLTQAGYPTRQEFLQGRQQASQQAAPQATQGGAAAPRQTAPQEDTRTGFQRAVDRILGVDRTQVTVQ